MTRRKNNRAPRKRQAAKNPFLSKSLLKELQKDAQAKARILQQYGFIPRQKSNAIGSFNNAKIARINRAFRAANKHGAFINGKVERVFRTNPRGELELSPNFSFIKKKGKNIGALGVTETRSGTLMQTLGRDTHIVDVADNGRITYREKIEGKYFTVHTSKIEPEWALDFLKRIKRGRYKFPKGYAIRITLFGYDQTQSPLLYSAADIKRYLTRKRKKHPSYELNLKHAYETGAFRLQKNVIQWGRAGIEPLKLEFIELKSGRKKP